VDGHQRRRGHCRRTGIVADGLPPHLVSPRSRRGNILNVYTLPSFRRQGIARRLIEVALNWCRANGIRNVILHASDEGQPLYKSLGFEQTNEMRLMVG
jgi:GNAT superfamily N-acetyltransferase